MLSAGFSSSSDGFGRSSGGVLPFTGIEALALVVLGAGATAIGVGLRKASQRA